MDGETSNCLAAVCWAWDTHLLDSDAPIPDPSNAENCALINPSHWSAVGPPVSYVFIEWCELGGKRGCHQGQEFRDQKSSHLASKGGVFPFVGL